MQTFDALNLVVLNGVREQAESTCNQREANSVIDLVCVDFRLLSKTHHLMVWDDEWSVDLSDHRLVSLETTDWLSGSSSSSSSSSSGSRRSSSCSSCSSSSSSSSSSSGSK